MRIAVLLGGVSSERKVSIKSGNAVAEALREAGHGVTPLDIVAEDIGDVVAAEPDVVFVALHGRFGEDGGVQALLEHEGIPFTGSDSQASRVAMDKMASKCFFGSHGVPTPDYRVVMASQGAEGMAGRRAAAELGLPLVVKPLRQGSSIGVSIVRDPAAVPGALALAFEHDEQAVLEKYVAGREVTVGILGDQALPVIELRYPGGFFDYDAKYVSAATEYIVNPALEEAERCRLQEAALRAHQALGCEGFSRVDMIMDRAGMPHVLEVNTIPGMTARSLFPMAARAAGLEFPLLCETLARKALQTRKVLSAS